jgi:hypothetical protein
MRRRLWLFLTGMTLLLAVVVLAFWIRSYWISDSLIIPLGKDSELAIGSSRGHGWAQVSVGQGTYLGWHHATRPPGPAWDRIEQDPDYNWEPYFAGVSVGYFYPNHGRIGVAWLGRRNAVHGPFVLIAAPEALLLLIFWLRLHRRRYARGMCQGCGYDLRASKTCCPECGRAVW